MQFAAVPLGDATLDPSISIARTCGDNPTHRPLEGVVTDKGVELRCLDCEYRQTKIPDAVLRAHPIDDPRR